VILQASIEVLCYLILYLFSLVVFSLTELQVVFFTRHVNLSDDQEQMPLLQHVVHKHKIEKKPKLS